MLEVLLASILFMLVASGFFVMLDSSRGPVADTEDSYRAAQVGRSAIENLRRVLGADTWDTTLAVGAYDYVDPDTGYNVQYTIESVDPGDNDSPKKVTMNIAW